MGLEEPGTDRFKNIPLDTLWRSRVPTTLRTERAHCDKLDDLQTLLEVSRELGATTELMPLLKKVEMALCQVLQCERATIFLYDKPSDELYSLVATGEELISFSARAGIAGEAFQTGALINLYDAYADPRFNPAIDRKTGYRTRNLITFPMRNYDGSSIGILQALNKKSGPFTQIDEEHAADLGIMAGVALQRQMLLDAYAQKQRIERDLSLAREIQQRLLPKSNPEIPGYQIAGWNQPAEETSGDFFDYIPMPDGCLGFLLADVMGHGIGPALIVSECRALVRALALTSNDPALILKQANRLLCEDMAEGHFVTTFFGVLDPRDHRLHYLSSGQGPLLHYQRQKGQCRVIPATTHPLGIITSFNPQDGEVITVQEGDMVILATDGFFEWANHAGDQFGVERLNGLVHQGRDVAPTELIQQVYSSVKEFGAGTPQEDDLTAVIIKRG